MPNFDIVKKTVPQNTFRISKIRSDFDLTQTNIQERFVGTINFPENWSIGVIVGGSGTGKTTIAKHLFGENVISNFVYTNSAIIDDMPKKCSVDEITKMFYSVGFSSVPSWLKPYSVLSNGEKMRVDLANALLERDFVVFDEFTSVVDRNVAQTCCIAINKAIKRTNKKFVAVTCHYDVLEWLQPDWVFDTNEMRCFFGANHGHKNNLQLNDAIVVNGENLSVIII